MSFKVDIDIIINNISSSYLNVFVSTYSASEIQWREKHQEPETKKKLCK